MSVNPRFKTEIRRLIEPVAKFECECCGKQVKRAGKFEHRYAQYVSDYVSSIMTVCRVCIYKLSFGSKGIMARKRNNQVEEETSRYLGID